MKRYGRKRVAKGPIFTKRQCVKAMQCWAKDSFDTQQLLNTARKEIKQLKAELSKHEN